MASITTQKELLLLWKKETFLNLGILNKIHPMSSELSRLVFKENALEKPTQNFLNHLCYYLVSIIDKQVSAAFPWPLYDSKIDKAFRNELAKFINDYSSKGLLSPVLSSYLVNPGSYKVQKLFYQMSQLAIQRLLTASMTKQRQKYLFRDISEKYKSCKEGFIEEIELTTEVMFGKFSNYLNKRKSMEKIAEILYYKIMELEEKIISINVVEYINNIVDNYVNTRNLDDVTKAKILGIKEVDKPAVFFDDWLLYTDKVVEEMEEEWSAKMRPFIELAQVTYGNTKTLISRYTGEMDKCLYMIEYNPKVEEIFTIDLQNQVNTEQKYILKNIVKDGTLNFPNLIRGFLIAISFILKNAEIDDEIYRFNHCLNDGSRGYEDMVETLRGLVIRIMNAQDNLQARTASSPLFITPVQNPLKPVFVIPELPDLSDIRSNRHVQCPISFDTFTPLNTAKHQFNLFRRSSFALSKPRSKSLFTTPFYQTPQSTFVKNLVACPANSFDRLDMTQDFHNLSIVPQVKANETIANCGAGFTKEQIMRLLSTKKTSSSKKHKFNTKRPDIKVVKTALFDESSTSNDTNNVLFRSHSSPNLFENRERKYSANIEKRRLSIMPEDMLEVSGILALDSKNSTPQEKSREIDSVSIPTIAITPCRETKVTKVLQEMEKEFKVDKDLDKKENLKSQNIEKTDTPKTNPPLIQKTNSLEKIINRFKKIRASVLPGGKTTQEVNEFKAIVEEKENCTGNVEGWNAKKFLLPDLLSPSFSQLTQNSDYLDQVVMELDNNIGKNTRQSLGDALGVDDTFLDQCDFID